MTRLAEACDRWHWTARQALDAPLALLVLMLRQAGPDRRESEIPGTAMLEMMENDD